LAVTFTFNIFDTSGNEAAVKAELMKVGASKTVSKSLGVVSYIEASVVLPRGVACLSKQNDVREAVGRLIRRPSDRSLDQAVTESLKTAGTFCEALPSV
jgi:hypothetical protein